MADSLDQAAKAHAIAVTRVDGYENGPSEIFDLAVEMGVRDFIAGAKWEREQTLALRGHLLRIIIDDEASGDCGYCGAYTSTDPHEAGCYILEVRALAEGGEVVTRPDPQTLALLEALRDLYDEYTTIDSLLELKDAMRAVRAALASWEAAHPVSQVAP